MNGNGIGAAPLVNFRYTVTLGNVMTMLIVVISVIVSWTRVTDGMSSIQNEQAQMTAVNSKMVDELNTLEKASAQQAAFIRDLRDRMSLDEAYEDNHRR